MNNTLEILNPVFCAAQEVPWIELGDHRARPLISSRQSGAFLLCEVEVDFMGGVPPHVHGREDETFVVLEGDFQITTGEQTVGARAGDTAFGPRGIPHTWHCTSESGGRLLLLVTPGENFESFLVQMGQETITPSDPASMAKLFALAEEHGLTMLLPLP
jgi:quercetin dioxygenase-like cupin family protein